MKKLNQTLLALAVIAAVVLLAIPTESVAAQGEGPRIKRDWTEKEPKEMDECIPTWSTATTGQAGGSRNRMRL